MDCLRLVPVISGPTLTPILLINVLICLVKANFLLSQTDLSKKN